MLGSWQAFDEFLDHGDIRVQDFIWRGQAKDWPLLPELYRSPDRYTACGYDAQSEAVHLDNFKKAYRSLKSAPPEPQDDDSWWALGRHYGLATPLLDWTESPLCAAFFALVEENGRCDHTRMVYALDRRCTELAAKTIGVSGNRPATGTGGMAHIVSPPRHNNARLAAQEGLFTYLPVAFSIGVWLKAWQADAIGRALLLKIRIPDNKRFGFLDQLERRRVSSLTLYPDVPGAAEYCNLQALARGRHRLRPARLTPASSGKAK